MEKWISVDESGKEMVRRVLSGPPLLLHNLPLRLGNVVELFGPSPSAKTHFFIQAAVSCVLPKEWNGVHYGGLEHLVMFLDLDCRFDVFRLSQSLKNRITEINGYDEELFVACMRRFLYICCYDSYEFLSTLKTLRYRLQKEREAHGVGVLFLMIDSIGAFYWVDRALASLPIGDSKRKIISLQSISETVVQEIQKLLLVHPMLVLATKATILGDTRTIDEVKGKTRRWCSPDTSGSRPLRSIDETAYREYLPSIWQSFVTHRMVVYPSASESGYRVEWLVPSVGGSHQFIVTDAGISIVGSDC